MDRDLFRQPRRKVVATAGLGLAATGLAACGGYGSKPSSAGGESASSAPSESGAAGKVLAKTSDVPVGSGLIVDKIVLTQPSPGVFKGLSAICTHKGCTLSAIADGTIDCPCHGSKFNLDGSVAAGPAKEPLKVQAISVQGDSIIEG
jgi:Rieske Fe-S protein